MQCFQVAHDLVNLRRAEHLCTNNFLPASCAAVSVLLEGSGTTAPNCAEGISPRDARFLSWAAPGETSEKEESNVSTAIFINLALPATAALARLPMQFMTNLC